MQIPLSNSESIMITSFRKLQGSEASMFFFEIRKLEIFSKNKSLFFCFLAFVQSFPTVSWLCFQVFSIIVISIFCRLGTLQCYASVKTDMRTI